MKPITETVISSFKNQFHCSPDFLVRAPGRVNLIGEHTDYNQGFVLPAAIDREIWITFRRRKDKLIKLYSMDFKEMIQISNPDPLTKENHWSDHILGTVWALKQQGFHPQGWEGVMAGDIPIGAGLSSSAATEIAIALACSISSDWVWDPAAMAKVGQLAEKGWVGVESGIMDQMVITNAEEGHALLLDCQSLNIEHIPIPEDVSIAVLDTISRRSLVNSPYTQRVKECHLAAKLLGLSSLRDLDENTLESGKDSLDQILYRRSRHVLTENIRVHQAVTALKNNRLIELGMLLQDSHTSLRNDFEVSSSSQNLIVEISQQSPDCLGARMTGAGFGGCAMALIKKDAVLDFKSTVVKEFRNKCGITPNIYFCEPSSAASREMVPNLDML